MLFVECYYTCLPGKRDEVLEYCKENIKGSRQEVGNIFYNHFPDPENEDGVYVFEKWESQEVFDKHDSQPHHVKFSALRRPLLVPNSFKIKFYEGEETTEGPVVERVLKHVKAKLN